MKPARAGAETTARTGWPRRLQTARALRLQPIHLAGAILALVLLGAWLAGLHHAAWLWPGQSDSAAAILMGQDMAGGNWLLNGWLLPVDTYWLTEEPLYAIAVTIGGVATNLMHDVPLVIYLGVIISGVLLARRGFSRARGWLGATTTFLLLGLLGPTAALTLIHGPAHVSTALACLLSFALLSWNRRLNPSSASGVLGELRARGLGVALAFVLLTLALASDPLARVAGAAPIAVVALITAITARTWRRSAAQLATVAASLVASQAVRLAALAATGYTVGGGAPGLLPPRLWLAKVPLFWSSLLKIFSADRTADGWLGTALSAAHLLVMVALVAAGLLALARLLTAGRDDETWFDGVLIVAAAGTAAAFFASGYAQDVSAIRYLSPTFIFSAVFAGRSVARLAPASARQPLAIGAAVLLVTYAVTFLGAARSPIPTNPAQPLSQWLLDRGLTDGYGAYWDANIVTVMSSSRVRIRPVERGQNGLRVAHWNSTLSWYTVEPARPIRFLVFEPAAPWGGVDETSAAASFGPPTSAATVGRYRVLIWDHDLAPLLASAPN